jgi:hypothetical protein
MIGDVKRNRMSTNMGALGVECLGKKEKERRRNFI